MWAAARDWINDNAGMKLQHIQADYLETYGSVASSTHLAVRVTKKPLKAGGYELVAAVWCDNWIGCDKPPQAALIDFNRTVSASFK